MLMFYFPSMPRILDLFTFSKLEFRQNSVLYKASRAGKQIYYRKAFDPFLILMDQQYIIRLN